MMMNQQNLEKSYPRSPRYVLQLKDKKILRYAPVPRGTRSFFTEIVNLSETGMAFTVPYLDTPQKNEIIMVEFTVPNSGPIACFAQVKRVQSFRIIEADFFEKNCKLVAVNFTNLQAEQSDMIRDGLSQEFKKSHAAFQRQQQKLKLMWLWKFKRKQVLISAAAATAAVAAAVGALIFW
jgi:hypothetical protein